MADVADRLAWRRESAREAGEVFAAAGGLDAGEDAWRRVVDSGVLELTADPADRALAGAVLTALGASGLAVPLAENLVVAHALGGAGLDAGDPTAPVAVHVAGLARVPFGAGATRILTIGDDLRWAPGGGAPFAEPDPAVAAVAAPASGELVTGDPVVVRDARARALLYRSAVVVGVLDTMLDLTIAWVSERRQFGRPVGSFQAVAHGLVEVSARVEAARALVVAGLEAPGPLEPEAALAAAATVSDAAARAVDRCYHFHGSVAHTADYAFHRWARRALALAWPSRAVRGLREELGASLVRSVADGHLRESLPARDERSA